MPKVETEQGFMASAKRAAIQGAMDTIYTLEVVASAAISGAIVASAYNTYKGYEIFSTNQDTVLVAVVAGSIMKIGDLHSRIRRLEKAK